MGAAPTTPVRRADLLGVLSFIGDLGLDVPIEHGLRQCLLALRLGERVGLDPAGHEAAYYTGLLSWVGCHVDAYEQAKWFGDDRVLKADFRRSDFATPLAGPAFMFRHLGAGEPLLARLRTAAGFLAGGTRDAEQMLHNHWRAVDTLAADLGLGDHVRKSIEQTFERWDGRGVPAGARGDEILPASRLVNLADVVEVFHRAGGVDAAVGVARARRGTQFDPALVDAFCDAAPELLAQLDTESAWDAVLASATAFDRPLTPGELDDALVAIADFTDVKSPCTIGHSRGVAELAGAAAEHLGLPADDVAVVRRAGLLHDLGQLGVSNHVWDKPGALTRAEAEHVRLHPHLTERTLGSAAGLAPLGAVAVQHHERLDGSGYPHGLSGGAVTPAGRILAAADLYRTKREPRPHRPALAAAEADRLLRTEVRAGRLDGDAVDAVLRAAGHRVRRRPTAVAGLTAREVEVLRMLARGLSNKQIAHELRISRKTTSNHIEHIYTKLGVNNRALASLAAARHGLVDVDDV